MARKTYQSSIVGNIIEPVSIPCPPAWRKAERAIIKLEVVSRDARIGRIDWSYFVPRQFTGYYYLFKDNFLLKNEAIDFRAMTIYEDVCEWKSETLSQQAGVRVPIPETTQPEENLEELTELILWTGNILSSVLDSTNIPFISDISSKIVELLEDVSSDNLYYLPQPYRPDKLLLGFRAGWANLKVTFVWYPFSPLSIAGGIAEVPLEEQIEPLEDVISPLDPTAQSEIKSFEDLAIEQGFVPPNLLPQACQGAGFQSGVDIIKNSINSSGLSPIDMLNELLKNGAISQADIDQIRTQNPSINDSGVLDKLAEAGKISIPEINQAIASKNAPSPNDAIFNSGNFASSGAQYCMTGKPLKIQRDVNNIVELEYIWSGTGSNNCQFFNATINPTTQLLTSFFSNQKTVFLRVYSGANNTGNYTLLNVGNHAKIISGNGIQGINLGDIVWRRGNTTYNTNVALPSRSDP